MVKKPEKIRPRSLGNAVSLILFWAALIWIGTDLVRTQLVRLGVARSAVEAVRLQNAEKPHQASALLVEARAGWNDLGGTASQYWLQKIQPRAVNPDRALAEVHRSLGQLYSDRQLSLLAERAFTLALSYDPELSGVSAPLLTEVFYTRNLELGYWAGARAREEGEPVPSSLIHFFERHYTGSR